EAAQHHLESPRDSRGRGEAQGIAVCGQAHWIENAEPIDCGFGRILRIVQTHRRRDRLARAYLLLERGDAQGRRGVVGPVWHDSPRTLLTDHLSSRLEDHTRPWIRANGHPGLVPQGAAAESADSLILQNRATPPLQDLLAHPGVPRAVLLTPDKFVEVAHESAGHLLDDLRVRKARISRRAHPQAFVPS